MPKPKEKQTTAMYKWNGFRALVARLHTHRRTELIRGIEQDPQTVASESVAVAVGVPARHDGAAFVAVAVCRLIPLSAHAARHIVPWRGVLRLCWVWFLPKGAGVPHPWTRKTAQSRTWAHNTFARFPDREKHFLKHKSRRRQGSDREDTNVD